MNISAYIAILFALSMIAIPGHARADGDAANGEKLFNGGTYRCYACHSLESGEQKVGPSLAGLIGRKAGSVEGFTRYSEAMMQSDVIWDGETLDKFLANPENFIPGNTMKQGGYYQSGRITSDKLRADVIAYLKGATTQ